MGIVFIAFFSLLYQNLYTFYQQLSFDALFPVSCYKTIVSDVTELLLDVQHVGQPELVISDRLMATDLLVGRAVRLMGNLDSFVGDQKENKTIYEQEAQDLLMLLGQVHTAYTSMDTSRRYPVLFPLLRDMKTRIAELL